MEGLRLARGIPATPLAGARHHHHPPIHVCHVSSRGTGNGGAVESTSSSPSPSPSPYMFPPRPLRRLWPRNAPVTPSDQVKKVLEPSAEEVSLSEGRRGENWVVKILRVQSLWAAEDGDAAVKEKAEDGDKCVACGGGCGDVEVDVSEGCRVDGEDEFVVEEFDRESFSKFLRRVSLPEAQLYAKMSYLGNLAYTIRKIKPEKLQRYHGLRFVTSSLEKKAKLDAEKDRSLPHELKKEEEAQKVEEEERENKKGAVISPAAAYEIAASAALYLQSQTFGLLPFKSSKQENEKDSPENKIICDRDRIRNSEVPDFVATTNSVTAVVAGKEEMKQAVANDFHSVHSSPCEWFVCDDDVTGTRYFVIQGSETLASWQANLLFEPIQFEGMDVLVHRGIYEAAKGVYEQMLPEIRAYIEDRGDSAKLRFTGHSLGGSLALLVNLLLLLRGEVPSSSLLPVIMFGAPYIFCGGDKLLQKLGLPKTHVQAITMHRDIVPRAFSCHYPDHVARILATVNGNFRNHPCLTNQKLLYAPMGKLLILQPEEKFSPNHHLLPPGPGLYLLDQSSSDPGETARLLQAAQTAFLNSPHPLEVLSDRAAYGPEGRVYRDHDVSAYLRSMYSVIREELKQIRKARRDHRREMRRPALVSSGQGNHVNISPGQSKRSSNSTTIVRGQCERPESSASPQHRFSFAGVIHGSKETLKRFGRLVSSQNVHILVVLFFPARLLVLGTFTVANLAKI